MSKYNIIIVFSPDRKRVLMCRRRKAPYQGLLNFIGGQCGTLNCEVAVSGEENPLFWIDSDSDFSDITRFSGVGNVYHMMLYIKANVFTGDKVLGK